MSKTLLNANNFFDYVSNFDYEYDKYTQEKFSLGKNITINNGTKKNYDLSKFDIAIFSIAAENTAKQIRKELYSLSFFDKKIKIIDLGDIKISDAKQTNFTLQEVLIEIKPLIKNIIILGSNNNLLTNIYNFYEFEDKLVNITEISPKINFICPQNETNNNDLTKILLNQNHKLFHFVNIGYQTHYTNIKTIDYLNSLGFEANRFGIVKTNITENEHLLRDSDIVSLDLSSVNYTDATDVINQTPNGFSAYEICQIAYYSGISDNSEIFSIFGLMNNLLDETNTTKLTAQIIWYYISGFSNRYNDNPLSETNKYKKISVAIENNNNNIVFYNNLQNNRWWFELIINNIQIAISCSQNDYNNTLNGNIPLRWIKFHNKTL
jgi:formiminoglutamase